MEPRKSYADPELVRTLSLVDKQRSTKEDVLASRFYRDTDTTIAIETAADELAIMLDEYEWFYAAIEEGKEIVVYCNYMNSDIMQTVPNVLYGHRITLAFSSYLECAENYGPNNKHVIWLCQKQ